MNVYVCVWYSGGCAIQAMVVEKEEEKYERRASTTVATGEGLNFIYQGTREPRGYITVRIQREANRRRCFWALLSSVSVFPLIPMQLDPSRGKGRFVSTGLGTYVKRPRG